MPQAVLRSVESSEFSMLGRHGPSSLGSSVCNSYCHRVTGSTRIFSSATLQFNTRGAIAYRVRMSVEIDERAILLGPGLFRRPGSVSGSSRVEASSSRATECVRRRPVVDERRLDTHPDHNRDCLRSQADLCELVWNVRVDVHRRWARHMSKGCSTRWR